MRERQHPMKRKVFTFLSYFMAAFILLSVSVSADIGPKPSVKVFFVNMGTEVCYGTLLSKDQASGPASVWGGEADSIPQYPEDSLDMKVWRAFTEYRDSDGFYYLQEKWLCSSTKCINWSYYPPDTFKILLYYPETDTFAVSGIYERKYFNSKLVVDMADVKKNSSELPAVITAKKITLGEIWEIAPMLFRLVLTVAVEILIALMFRFGIKKSYMIITVAVTNIATQMLLNLTLTVTRTSNHPFLAILLGLAAEAAIFVMEAVVYIKIFRKISKKEIPTWKTAVYAFTANMTSFLLGLIIF